ncbi:protein of unknown function DUF980 [Desulfurispirillum indicum S5]|uniref:Protein MtfA n=1 Tax=Desulfurispirillum indicum (strain ATCC BAA-1389 / DSM 22839 / S5) TaxID=653733 RepID=E6W530_DESIS|nr:M90 family metallopeptidase [Desulfurispirillum indicum]ADU66006.1 protein of unknown function DUF980 [Desulfurispirillum indicum S5]
MRARWLRRWFRLFSDSEGLDLALWQNLRQSMPLLKNLSREQQRKLQRITDEFLSRKTLLPAAGFAIDARMKHLIALQACVPLVNLNLNVYRSFDSIIVYADEFIPRHALEDENGIVHLDEEPLIGESWYYGPVILSWNDVSHDAFSEGNTNVVIHEMAHQIDMLSGDADGVPLLHPDMSRDTWRTILQAAFREHGRLVKADEDTVLDPYGAEDPAEFFAVSCECFFKQPRQLRQWNPQWYEQLARLFAWDTAHK